MSEEFLANLIDRFYDNEEYYKEVVEDKINDMLYVIYIFLLTSCKNMVSWIYGFFVKKQETPQIIKPPETIVSLSSQYMNREQEKFLLTYEKESTLMNVNMDELFYNIEEYNAIIKNEHSDFEKTWRTRVLYENTPRGNILMYYDAFKKGFAYYADIKGIPYAILNAVAMKYVRIYLCRDLFVDEKVTPESSPSPLIKLQEIEDKKEVESKKEKSGGSMIDKEVLKKAPFAKLKNYKMEEKKTAAENNTSEKKNEPLKIVSVNRFIYMGKQCDFAIIQRIPKKNVRTLKIEKTGFSDMFEKEHDLQVETMSYKDYVKAMKNKKNN